MSPRERVASMSGVSLFPRSSEPAHLQDVLHEHAKIVQDVPELADDVAAHSAQLKDLKEGQAATAHELSLLRTTFKTWGSALAAIVILAELLFKLAAFVKH